MRMRRQFVHASMSKRIEEGGENEDAMTHSATATTTTTPPTTAIDTAMGSGSRKIASAGDLSRPASKSTSKGDVTRWTSVDVQHWIDQQSKKFELKKTAAEKFEMNGRSR